VLRPRISSLLLVFAVGCRPTCDQVCRHLLECGNLDTPRMTVDECSETCHEQQDLLQQWSDTELRASFDDEMECLGGATCDDIAAGTCYDPDLWSY
jgi:hypothetical protein